MTHTYTYHVNPKLMLTLEIKINGIVISIMKITNTTLEMENEVMYGIEAYISGEKYTDGKLIKTSICHNPDDGAIILVQKAINQIVDKL